MTNKQLYANYCNVCNTYIEKFCKKHDIEFDFWVGDEIGGIASFSCQYFFNLSDIIFDINTRQPKLLILKWQEDGVDFNFNKEDRIYINYKSYSIGARYNKL